MMHARGEPVTVLAVALTAMVIGSSTAQAQDIGFGLGDPYRYYADPGNGGGSAYAPFFDPYRGNRIVRGAYPDASYDGFGYHYGKSTPPSLRVDPREYDAQSYLSNDPHDHGDRYRLRESETMTTRREDRRRQLAGLVVEDAVDRRPHFVERSRRASRPNHRRRSAEHHPMPERSAWQ